MGIRKKNRALAYLRRSTDRQEISLPTQLEWAMAEAARHSVSLDASPADLDYMQATRRSSYKGLRIDDGISGADLTRPGFLGLMDDSRSDPSISHLLIYRRDRFARPEDATKMVVIEKDLRLAGLTIVFADGVAGPLVRGQADLAGDIAMMLGYYESGEFLRKHAERVLVAQRQLALGGFRVGGNPPYGFVRALVNSAGEVLEELPPGRLVRQAGCHVRIMPKDADKIATWLMILELKQKGWGYKRIAGHLNELGIASPGAGSFRTDQGVRHLVSGKWGPNAVKELCENRAILGLQDYGRRSEGAHRRLGQGGPRLLTDADRDAKDRPRVVKNNPSAQISAPIGAPAHFDERRWEEIQQQVKKRGQSQRGIPRAKDPARFPLACRIVDLSDGCGSIMYGYRHGGRPVYVCGSYMRTAGAECEHNLVDGEAVLRFTLLTLRQLVERAGNRERLRALLEKRARQAVGENGPNPADLAISRLEAGLGELRAQLGNVQRRMAIEPDEARYQALGAEFDRIRAEVADLERGLVSQSRASSSGASRTVEEEVEAAMAVFDNITRITTDERARGEINSLLVRLGMWLGLNFIAAIKGKKRAVRQLVGGVMAFGQDQLPVRLHGARNADALGGTLSGRGEDMFPDAALGAMRPGAPEEMEDSGGPYGQRTLADHGSVKSVFVQNENTRSLEGQREGVSFTKDSRGGGI